MYRRKNRLFVFNRNGNAGDALIKAERMSYFCDIKSGIMGMRIRDIDFQIPDKLVLFAVTVKSMLWIFAK